MATEADIPESVLHKNSEGEDTYLTTTQFEKTILESLPLPAELEKPRSQLTQQSEETHECWEESKNMDIASKTQVEIANDVINNYFGASGDASFLASPSASIVSNEELKPSEIGILENAKHLDKSQQFGVTEETKEEDEVIVEENQKADQDDKDPTVETSSLVAETGEPKLKVEEGETVKNEINLDQNVELILKQQDTVTGSPQSIEEETKGLEKDEEGGKLEEKITKLSSKEVFCIPDTTLDHTNEASVHSPDLRINKDVQSVTETGDAFNYKFERISVIDEREVGTTEQDEQKEVSSTTCKEHSQHANESSKQEREAPIANEMQDKESSLAPFITEAVKVCSQEVDNAEVVCPEHVAKESPIEVTKQTEFLAETAQVTGTAGSHVHDAEISEQKIESSSASGEHDEDIHCKGEALDITDAAIGEARDTEGSSLAEAKDISTSKGIHGEEPRGLESTKHEGYLEDSLSQNEPEKEKPQEHSNGLSEEREDVAAIISIEEERQIKDLEESIEQKEKEQNISLTDLDKKTEGTVEFPNNDANNSQVMSLLVEQVREVESGKISEVSEPEFHEKIQKSIEASTNEEKHVQAESEADKSKEKENLLHTSAEGIAPTEIILETSESVKKTESSEAEDTGEIIKKEAEITDTEIQKCTTKSRGTEEGTVLDDVTVKVDDIDKAEMDSPISDVGIPEEETLKSIGEDKSHELKSTEGDLNKEQITEGDVTSGGPDSIDGSQENVKVSENLNEEESSTEIQKEGYSSDLPQENIQEDATKTLKDHEDEAEKSQTEIVEELETAGTGESIAHERKEDVEKFVDASSVKQEGEEQGPMDASVKESEVEDTFSTEVLEDNDENAVKDTQIEVVSKDREDKQEDEQGEKLDNLPHVTPEENETELSTEKNTNIACTEGEETSETETKELAENVDNKDNSEEEVLETTSVGRETREHVSREIDEHGIAELTSMPLGEVLETAEASASVACETKEDVEKSVDPSSVKQEDDQLEEVKNQGATEASAEENKVEDTFPSEVVEDDEDNTVKATEIIEEASKDGEDQHQTMQKDEPGEKLENLPHVTPEGTETEPSSEYDTNILRMESEENIQKPEETSETEKKEPAKNVDSTDDSEKEVLETISVGKENREQVLGENDEQDTAELSSSSLGDEIGNESSKEHEKLHKLKEDDTHSEIKEQNGETDLTEEHECVEPQKEASEEEKLPEEETEGRLIKYTSDTVKDETVSEETHLKEAEPDNEEQIKSFNITQEKAPASSVNSEVQSDSVPTEILKEETCMKIAEDNEELELVKSSNITFQEKVLTSSDDIEKQPESISTEIVGEQKGFKEAKTDNEEHVESSNIALEEKGLASSEDLSVQPHCISTEIVSEEARLKEVQQDEEEHVQSSNFAPEEKGLANSEDIELQSDSVLTEIVREETGSKKAEPDNQEKESSSTAPEEKDQASIEDIVPDAEKEVLETSSTGQDTRDEILDRIHEQGLAQLSFSSLREETVEESSEEHEFDSVAAGTDSEETHLKEEEPENKEQVKSYDIASEEKSLANGADTEVQSVSVSTEIMNKEKIFEEVEADNEEQPKISDVALEEKGLATSKDIKVQADSVSTEIVSEKNGLEIAEQDNEEKVKSSIIYPEEKGLTSIEDSGVQPDYVSTEIVSEETGLKAAEPENEEQVTNSNINFEEKGVASTEDVEVKPDSVSTEIVSEETRLVEAESDSQEQVGSSSIATEEKGLASSDDIVPDSENEVLETTRVSKEIREQVLEETDDKDTAELSFSSIEDEIVNESSKEHEKLQKLKEDDTHSEFNEQNRETDFTEEHDGAKPRKEALEEETEGRPTKYNSDSVTINKETHLKEAEPDNEERIKSFNISPQEEAPASSVDSEVQSGSVPTEIVKEETCMEIAEDNEELELVKSSNIAFQEKVLNNSDDIEEQPESISTEIIREQKVFKEAKPDTEEHVESSNIALEEKGLASSEDVSVQPHCISTEIVSEEVRLKEVQQDEEGHTQSSNFAPEEKGPANSEDIELQSDFVLTEIVREETGSKQAEPDNQEKESLSIALEEKDQASIEDIVPDSEKEVLETSSMGQETKDKILDEIHEQGLAQLSFSSLRDETAEESSKEHEFDSVTAGTVSEETHLKEEPENKELVKSYEIASEEKSLASGADTEVQSVSASTEIMNKENRFEEVKQENEEQPKISDVALEEKGLATSKDIEVQADSASTEIVREETGSKKAEPDNQEKESSSIAPEEKDQASIEDIVPDSEKEVLETSSMGQETKDEILDEIHERGLAQLSFSSLRDETAEESSKEHEFDSVTAGTVSEETHLKEEPENKELVKSYEIASEEKSLASGADTEVQSVSASTEIMNKENRFEEVKQENEEQPKISDVALEEKCLATSKDIEVQADSASTEIVSEKNGLEIAEQDNEEKVKSSIISPEEKGLTSTEDSRVQPDNVSTEILCEETGLKAAGPENEEQVTHSNINIEEKGVASSENVEVKPDSVSTEIVSKETRLIEAESDSQEQVGSSSIAYEEKGLASSEDIVLDSENEVLGTTRVSKEIREQVLEETNDKDTAVLSSSSLEDEIVNESSKEHEKLQKLKDEDTHSEFKEQNRETDFTEEHDGAKPRKEALEEETEGRPTKYNSDSVTINEETHLKEAEPDNEERIKSFNISPQEEAPASSVDSEVQSGSVPTEIVKEKTCMKIAEDNEELELVKSSNIAFQEKVLTNSDDIEEQPESISTEIIREQKVFKEAKPDTEERVESSNIALEEKGLASSEDVSVQPHCISTEIVSEEARLKEVQQVEEEHIQSSNFAPEEKGPAKREDIELQSNSVLTEIVREETGSKKAEPDNQEKESSSVAPEEKDQASIEDIIPDSEKEVLETSSTGQETRDEILDEIQEQGLAQLSFSSLREETVEESSKEHELDSVTAGTISEETYLKEEKPENKEQFKSYNVASGEKSLASDADTEIQSVSVSTEIVNKEIRFKEVKPDNEEKPKISDVALEEKDLAASKDIEVQADSVSTEIVSEKNGLEIAEPDEEKVKSSIISPEEKALTSTEDGRVQPDYVSTEIVNEETGLKAAKPENEELVTNSNINFEEKGVAITEDVEVKPDSVSTEIVSEETRLVKAESDSQEQVGSSSIASEEKGLASSEDIVPDSENEVLETTRASKEIREQVLEETDEKDTAELSSFSFEDETVNESSKEHEKLQKLKEDSTHSEFNKQKRETDFTEEHDSAEPRKEASEEETEGKPTKYNSDSVTTGTMNEETHLKEAEPDNEEQIKSFNITPQEVFPANSVDSEEQSGSVPTEIVKEDTCMEVAEDNEELELVKSSNIALQEKVLTNSDDIEEQPESISTEIVSEQKVFKEAKSDTEEHVESSNIALEEKGLASSEDVSVQPHCISTEIVSEEARLKLAEQDDEERVQSSNLSPEEKGLANSDDIEVQSNSVLTETDGEEIGSKKAEPDNQEQAESSDIAPEEKGQASSEDIVPDSEKEVLETFGVEQETRDEILDKIHEQDPLELSFSSFREETVEESSKEHDFESATAGTVSEETHLQGAEPENKEQDKSYDTAPEQQSLASSANIEVQSVSVTTEIVNEETGVKEVKPDNVEHAGISNVALEEKDLATGKDIEVQADSVSTEIVSEKTGREIAEPDNEEQVKSSIISPEEKGLASSKDSIVQPDSVSTEIVSDETGLKAAEPENEEQVKNSNINFEEKGGASSEDVEVKPDYVLTEIVSEKTRSGEAESESQEQVRSSSTASEENGLANSEDIVPDSEKEELETSNVGQETRDKILDETHELSSLSLREEPVEEKWHEFTKLINSHMNSEEQEFDSAAAGTVREETRLKEAEPENKEQDKSNDVVHEEKSLASGANIEVQSVSVSTEIVNEETGFKEAKPDNEEHAEISNVALEQGLTTSNDMKEQADSVSIQIVSEKAGLEIAEQDGEEKVKSSIISPEEKSLVSSEDSRVQPGSVSTEFIIEETELKATELENEEQVTKSNISFEEKGVASSEDVVVQPDSDSVSNEIVSEETRSNEAESDSQEQVQSSSIAPGGKGLASIEDIVLASEKEVLKSTGEGQDTRDKVFAKNHEQGVVVLSSSSLGEETVEESSKEHDFNSAAAGIVTEETRLKEAEPENKEQVKSYDIAAEEKSLACGEVIEAQSVSASTEIMNVETGFEEAKPDNEEHDKISNVALEEKSLATSKDIEVQPDSVSTEIISEKTGLEIAEPDNEEKIKSSIISLEEKSLATSEDCRVQSDSVSTEVVSEGGLKATEPENEDRVTNSNTEEKGVASSEEVEEQADSVLTVIVSEETGLKEAESDGPLQVGSSSIVPEEKGLASSEDIVPDSTSTKALSEETKLEVAEPDNERQDKSSDIASGGNNLETNVDTELQFDSLSTIIVYGETGLKEEELDNKEQVRSCDSAPNEESQVSSIDGEVQSESVLTEIGSEEIGLKRAEPANEEQVKILNIASKEKGLARSLDIEEKSDSFLTRSVEAEADTKEHAKSYDIAPEEKGLQSNLDMESAEIVSEDTNDARTSNEQVHSYGNAPEDESLESNADIEVRSNSVSDRMVSEETDLNKTEADNNEQIKSLAIGIEEAGSGRFEVQEEKCPNAEENEENLTTSDTPLDDRSKHNLEDSSRVTSTEHELITTKASERSDEITAIDGAQSENKKSPIIEPTEEEKMLQKEDESKQKDESMESSATAREEIQKERELELNLPAEITSDKSSSKSEAVKASEKEEASDGAYQSEVYKLETLKTEDNSVAEVENAAVESEVDNTINNKYLTKENLESADPDQKLAQSSEAVTEDQTEETLLLPKKTQTEQNEDSVHDQNCESVTQQTLGENFDGAKEIKVEEEPKLPVDSHVNEIQSPNEIIKDVILTEVHEGVERTDEQRGTEEQVIDGERNLQEFHPVSTEDERLYKEKEVEEPKLVSVAQDIDETRLIPTVEKMDTKEIKEASQTEDERLHEEKEVEETKLASVTQDIDETRLIPTVEKIDMKEINEASQTVSTSKYATVEAVNEVELRNEQALSAGLSKEQLQEPSSTTFPKEEEHDTNTTDKIEEESIKEVDKQADEKIEDSSATHLQKEEANEPKLPELAAEKLGIQETEDNKTAPETLSKSICEIIHDNRKDDIITKQDASVGISAEQVEVSSSPLLPKEPELETFVVVDKTEDENTKELEMLDNKDISGSFSTEASVETCLKKEDSMDLKFSEMASENLSKEEIVEASDAASISNSQSIKVVTEDTIIIDDTVTAEISKDQLQVPLPTLLPEEQEPAIAFKKVEEESIEVKMLDKEDTEDSSATKTAEEAQKEEPRELKVSYPLVKKLSGDHSEEEIKEIPETVSKPNSLSNEVVAEDKMITCQTSPEKTSAMQAEDGTTMITTKEMEEVHAKKVEMPSYENRKDDSSQKTVAERESQKEEPKKHEVSALTVEVLDGCKVKEDIIEASEASNLNIETSEEACDFQSKKAECQEAFTRIENAEIIENHLKIAATDLGTEDYQRETKIEAEKTRENEISDKGVQSTEISQEKGSLGIEKSHEITQDVKQPEESSHATSKEQTPTPTPADCDESTGTKITTTNRDVPPTMPDPIEETSQRAEPKETKVYAEIKGDESGREKEVDDSVGKTTEIESKISLSELLQSPTRETTQVAKRSIEEKDPNSKEAKQNQKLHEEKDHQEEEEEEDHEDEDHPDAPILVHASGDVDVKTKHKKSHNIFSGVGSKVKHSISKVKKAIIGKSSSHSKTLPSS